jgi:hypothetical protein
MKRLALLSLALFLTAASTSHAQVRPLGLQEIVQSAGCSFIGTVTGTRSAFDANQQVVTYTTFRVDEAVTGRPNSVVTIKQLGGVIDGQDLRITHIRYFVKGEQVLVAMYPNSDLGFSNPVGLDQAVWPVTKGGRILNVTARQLEGMSPILSQYGIAQDNARPSAALSVSRDSFTSLIKALASDRAAMEKTDGGH